MRENALQRNLTPCQVFRDEMRSRATHVFLAAIVAMLAAAAVALAQTAGGGTPKSVVLGKTTTYPDSGCPVPAKCQVVARVTGIQMAAGGVAHPFRVPSNGQLVSWWLRLPRLQATQIRSFNSLFGGEPAARIAVLRRGVGGRFRLVRQSDTQPLKQDLGHKGRARYRLAVPLRVKAGDYVGLTAVTWVPSFAVDLDATQNYWLASRARKKCTTPSSSDPKRFAAYYKQTQAHLESSTPKLYQCTYRTARLLYWARIMPDPTTPSPAPKPTG